MPNNKQTATKRNAWSTAAVYVALSVSAGAAALSVAHAAGSNKAAATASPQQWVKVEGAWIRASVEGQQATGGFMDLTSTQDVTLVGFETKVAKHAELHEMAMEGDVMRMRAVDSLPLVAGNTVSLKPGSYHLMLTDLKKPLADGSTVGLTLLLKASDGKVRKQLVSVPVKAPQMAHPHSAGHDHMH